MEERETNWGNWCEGDGHAQENRASKTRKLEQEGTIMWTKLMLAGLLHRSSASETRSEITQDPEGLQSIHAIKGEMWSFKRLKVLILGCSVNICCRLQSLGEEGREKQMNVLGGRMTVGPKKSEHEVCPSWELRSRRTQQAVLWTRLLGPLLQVKPEAQDNQREGWLPLWEAK